MARDLGAHSLRLRYRSLVVIPARLASTRLPGKMLLCDTGKPLVQHTYESAARATRPMELVVATDAEEIAEAVRQFGGRVELTDPCAASGTDRVAELAGRRPDIDVFVNVQGDEPEISPRSIDLVIELLESHPEAHLATVAAPIRSRAQLEDPACVKVVCDARGQALYFSRSPIPHVRSWDDSLLNAHPPHFYQHIGLYAFRRHDLLEFASLPRSPLEQLESLEQLRALAAGKTILVGQVDELSCGIDTPDDYRAFVRRWRKR